MAKKIMCVLLSVCLLTGLLATGASAAEIVASGEYGYEGDNITWTLDENGVMTFSGSGYMIDCYQTDDQWTIGGVNYAEMVKYVVIEDGIDDIGTYAFSYFTNLKNVIIPDSVKFFGARCFNKCTSLLSVNVPQSVEFLEQGCFNESGLKVIYFEGTEIEFVTEGSYRAFESLEEAMVIIPYGFRIDYTEITDENAHDDEFFYNADVHFYDKDAAESGYAGLEDLAHFIESRADGEAVIITNNTYFQRTLHISNDVVIYAVNPEYSFITVDSDDDDDCFFIESGSLTLAGGGFETKYGRVVCGAGESGSLTAVACDVHNVYNYSDSFELNVKAAEVDEYTETAPAEINIYSGGACNWATLSGANVFNIKGDISECLFFVTRAEAGYLTNGLAGNGSVANFASMSDGLMIAELNGEAALVGDTPLEADCSVSLSLGGDIGVNFYYAYSDSLEEAMTIGGGTFTIKFLYQNKITTGELQQSPDPDYDLKSSFTVNAKEMTEPIKATLYYNDTAVNTTTVTVKDYAMTIINDVTGTYNNNLKNLSAAMLLYGAAAQDQFGYRVEDKADADLANYAMPYVSVDTSDAVNYDSLEEVLVVCGLKIEGSTLVLNTKTAYRLYFTVTDPGAFEANPVTLNGKTLTPKKYGKYYYCEIPDIPAPELFDTVILNFGGFDVPANPLNYIKSALVNGDQTLKNTVNALYVYVMMAHAYFN